MYLDSTLYHKEIIPKTNAFKNTILVKSIKANWSKYGIKFGDIISKEMLMGIILYCDYTDLSSNFSGTFRKNNSFEPLQAVKKRNQKYYWLAKTLKEMITCYGQSNRGGCGLLSRLSSPLFCGMSFVMNMPQFNINLFGPTSTTKELITAANFSGDTGIIIEFDNTKGHGIYVNGFDVSFLSRYGGQEEERYIK